MAESKKLGVWQTQDANEDIHDDKCQPDENGQINVAQDCETPDVKIDLGEIEESAGESESTFDCFSCEIVETYIGVADTYIDGISVLLVTPVKILFIALAGLWIVWSGIKFVLGNITPQKL